MTYCSALYCDITDEDSTFASKNTPTVGLLRESGTSADDDAVWHVPDFPEYKSHPHKATCHMQSHFRLN